MGRKDTGKRSIYFVWTKGSTKRGRHSITIVNDKLKQLPFIHTGEKIIRAVSPYNGNRGTWSGFKWKLWNFTTVRDRGRWRKINGSKTLREFQRKFEREKLVQKALINNSRIDSGTKRKKVICARLPKESRNLIL